MGSSAAPSYRIDYRGLLDDQQLAVVEAPMGPLLVIAGAGSGKTRTLVFRLARMLESGIPPERIVLLTFSNRAAREMLQRAGDLVSAIPGLDVRRIRGGTFHRVGNQILRRYASLLGFEGGFGILDREDQVDLLSDCISELGFAVGQRRFPKADLVADLVSASINTQRPIEEVILLRRPQFEPVAEELAKVALAYQGRKLRMNLMDFDDLLLHWKILLTDRPEVRAQLQDEFQGILVDEYQDTNRLQADIVEKLAEKHRNLTVVGDDAQSIYSFRGAELTHILELPARYPGCEIHRLTNNYRSTPRILALANASIAKNARQFPKELTSRREEGELPVLVPARDAVQQASFIAQRILELRDEGIPLDEVAILYRAHFQSMEIQIELSRRGIPFQVRSGARFFEQAHVKDVLAFLRIALNPTDELAFKRVVRLFPGIGTRIAQALWEAFREGEGLSTMERLITAGSAAGRARAGWERCREILVSLAGPAMFASPSASIDAILEGGYRDWLQAQFLNADARVEDLRQLGEYALQFEDTAAFLEEISLLTDFSTEDLGEGAPPDEQVTLSSIHRAKGLEWRAVFLAWLAEGGFPTAASLREPQQEEEERRCFYVAVTRARDELYLSYPMLAAPRDGERRLMRPSRFIQELMVDGEGPWEKWTLDEEPVVASLPPAPSRLELAEKARTLLLSEGEE